jgi:hypothetical protein
MAEIVGIVVDVVQRMLIRSWCSWGRLYYMSCCKKMKQQVERERRFIGKESLTLPDFNYSYEK